MRTLHRAAWLQAQGLGELEAVAVAGIALQSTDVDMAQHVMTVELRAASQAALDEYLDQLSAGLAVPAWRLARLAADASAAARAPGVDGLPAGGLVVTLVRRF